MEHLNENITLQLDFRGVAKKCNASKNCNVSGWKMKLDPCTCS